MVILLCSFVILLVSVTIYSDLEVPPGSQTYKPERQIAAENPLYLYDRRPEVLRKAYSKLVKGCCANRRRKRTTKVIRFAIAIGLRAVRKLLKGTKFMIENDNTRIFEKHGGYSQAFKDFHSVKPLNVQTVGVHKSGQVGDRLISLEGGDGKIATMVIQRPSKTDASGVTMDIIIYKD